MDWTDVRELVERAGVAKPSIVGGGTLTSESILIFRGNTRSSLNIFELHGKQIGAAVRTSAPGKTAGYRYKYVLGDTETRCFVRETTPWRRLLNGPAAGGACAFSIDSADGAASATALGRAGGDFRIVHDDSTIATLHQLVTLKELSRDRPTSGPTTIRGRLRRARDLLNRTVLRVADPNDVEFARVTYLGSMAIGSAVDYVIELQPDLSQELQMIALSSCIIADNRIFSVIEWGDG